MNKGLRTMTKIFMLIVLTIISISFLFSNQSQAGNINNEVLTDNVTIESMSTDIDSISTMELYPDHPELSGRTYFIKNMYTGQYLDVQGGVAADGTNVWQYKFNGTQSQQWYIHSYGDGTYSLYTPLGNDGTYRYALDISQGSGENYANVQIYTPNGSDAQRFSIGKTNYSTYALFSKCSNYGKVVVVNGPTCDQGRNVDQYTYQGHVNEVWILEPVGKVNSLGVDYAKNNYNHYVSAYPDVRNLGGDCANFVSQCMLASGIHYQDDWKVYRNNSNYSAPTSVDQLNNTWELCAPKTSPWISAAEFKNFWKNRVTTHVYKGSQITANPSLAWNLSIVQGDVIQMASNILNIVGNAEHTMYVTGYANSSYILTYHSGEEAGKNLLDICAKYPDKFFVFYEMI